MLYSKIQFYFVCFLLITALSCKDKDKDPNADCGCDGSTTQVVENVKGSYTGKSSLVLYISYEENKVSKTYVSACNITDTLKITPDINNPDYIISGSIKKDCYRGESIMFVPSAFEVKSVISSFWILNYF